MSRTTIKRTAAVGATILAVVVVILVAATAGNRRSESFEIGAVATVDPRLPSNVTVQVVDATHLRVTFGSRQRPSRDSTPGTTIWDAQTRVTIAQLASGTRCGVASDSGTTYGSYLRRWPKRESSGALPTPYDLFDDGSGGPPTRRRADLAAGSSADLAFRRRLPKKVCVSITADVGNGVSGFSMDPQSKEF